MNYLAPNNILIRPARRTAALLCAAVLGLGLAAAPRTSAQTPTGPLTGTYASPPTPTPFQWQNYHSGGAPIPATQFPVAPDPNAALGLTPLIDPLQSQLQGTPTELYNGSLTEIPSFLLGNFDPTRPPGPLDPVTGNLNFYPNHFQDGSIFSWAAPFSYIAQGIGTVSVDDSPIQAPTATASGFTITGNWVSVTDPNGTTPGPVTSPAAATATGDEYLRLPSGAPGTAIWTLDEPTAGVYSVYFHIPNDLPDSNGAAEVRSTQVLYFIRVLDANGNVTANTTATVSQTEANDSQFLAGPFQVAAGGSVVVTLTRSVSNPVLNYSSTQPYTLVADSMTLQQTVGDVQSAPTVITQTSYPTDFARAQYWGIFVPTNAATLSTSPDPATAAAANAAPDTAVNGDPNGTVLLKTGDPNACLESDGVTKDLQHLRLIRQLVYFGRSDPSASVTATVDDSNQAAFSGSGTTVSAPTTPTAVTASNNEYRVSTTAPGTTPTTSVATWTVPVPAAGAGSNFFVYAHIPATAPGEIRLPSVFYTVTVTTGMTAAALPIQKTYNASISQQTQGADALVVLPTGALTPLAGTNIVVTMYSQNNSTAPSPTGTVVVADSVNVSTGTGQGAIYCVDGFTGGVVWRFPTPGSATGASAPVFASPAIAKINVVVTPATATAAAVYANKLVVIVGDNNGLVYCLDAIGNGDGTSNFDVLNPTTLQPITIPQPAYGAVVTPLASGTAVTGTNGAAATAHVGTTGIYWIYRPDATQPKYVTGTAVGTVKPVDPTTDLPVPAAFNTASPTIFVDPTVSTGTTGTTPTAPTASDSIVYIGSSNGVLYALDGGGASIDGTTQATFNASGDTFNVSQDLQQAQGFPKLVIPSAQPKWWFSLRGVDPNGAENTSSADIESAPALYIKRTTNTAAATTTYVPTVYIGSAHEQEATSNVGRLYALNGLYGPSGNGGRLNPVNNTPTAANYGGPGAYNYNVGQVPQTDANDAADWSFPDGNTTTGANNPLAGFKHQSSTGNARPALGNITGSPVVFTNIDETVGNPTRIYIAANSGLEPTAAVPNPAARPDDTQTGRIWAVNLDGSVGTTTNSGTNGNVWAYPVANNPNDATKDNVAEPYPPIGSFLRATPAIGFVQFPALMQFIPTAGGAVSNFSPVDAVHTGSGIAGQTVPMLYVGTRGVNDSSLYAVDIDGDMTALPQTVTTTASGTSQNDQRTIYRLVSPDGSIYQSSVALVTNATSQGGNGGSVYAVAGNTMYDYGATPISNPFSGNDFPLIPENRVFIGLGPISSPALAGASTTDLSQAFLTNTNTTGSLNTSAFTTNTTDWVIIGDSTSGLCRGITPQDLTYGGIPPSLGTIIPPDPNAPLLQVMTSKIQTFLVDDLTTLNRTSSKAYPVGATAPLPVYDWGESAYACFTNVAPPNPKLDPALFVHDTILYPDLTAATPSNPIPFYTSDGSAGQSGQTVTFNLSDPEATPTGTSQGDSGSVLPGNYFVDPGLLTADPKTPKFTQDVANVVQNLVANNGNRYIGTYIYTIGDGSGRDNTPGARRRFQGVKQKVAEYDYVGNRNGSTGGTSDIGNYDPKPPTAIGGDATPNNITPAPGGGSFVKVAAVDQPTFGILNPLAVRGGGVNLLAPGSVNAVPVGDEAGPFRSVETQALPLPTFSTQNSTQGTVDILGMQALANGNDILPYAPPSSSGVGASPVALPNPATDPTAPAQTTTKVVVTATGLISHNSVGDNSEPQPTSAPQGTYNSGNDGLAVSATGFAPFGGYSLNAADRSALFNLGQTLRVKSTVPPAALNVPSRPNDGLYWNSNAPNTGFGTSGHDSVVNFLPWETPPTPYSAGINSSLDYPDIAAGNVAQNAQSITNSAGVPNYAGDLSSNSVTLTPGVAGGTSGTGTPVQNRTVYGDPVQIKITVPHYQPPNQQLYQQVKGSTAYDPNGQIAPVNAANGNSQITTGDQAFPMGYIAYRRLFVPSAIGRFSTQFSTQRPYRDVHIFTGVPIDMKTSIANPTTDIGQVPAAFGVQTEQYAPLGLFTPYNPAFTNPNIINSYFKPLTVHNDGNVNMLNIHFDQMAQSFTAAGTPVHQTLHLFSDTDSLLSVLDGFDIDNTTGPHTGTLPSSVPEQSYLVRTSLDSDIFRAYGQNPYFGGSYSAAYPGATFHKPLVGSDQPSTLTVPDAPESYVAGASLNSQPVPTSGTDPSNSNLPYKSSPFVSIAVPFGTPVGTYMTTPAGSLRLFEGLDTAAANAYNLTVPPANSSAIPSYLYPPKYGKAVGGIGGFTTGTAAPIVDSGDAGQPEDANGYDEDIYNGNQPISTTGTVLSGTVKEQRLTDGATYGAVPMIDAGPAVPASGNTPATSTPDFAPAAFRDPATGNLSVYWTSGRGAGYSIYGANVPFASSSTGAYFFPSNLTGNWWGSIAGYGTATAGNPAPLVPVLTSMTGTTPTANSGLSISAGSPPAGANLYAFDVYSANAPYTDILYSYLVTPKTGLLGAASRVSPLSDDSQVKYGIKGLYTGTNFASANWVFWTANTRGRTALYYSPQSAWGTASTLLPVPAGLTAVSDASPLLITAPVVINGSLTYTPTIEVTYSGTGPDGNADIYVSRYLPDSKTPAQLDLVPFPAVTENLRAQGNTGWYQGRDTAWSRSGALNVLVPVSGSATPKPLLYDATGKPLFTQAIYDKASGFLVLTGVQVPFATVPASGAKGTTNTVYVDAATGRIRFSPALITATQSFPTIRATFSPMARRLTIDTRADVGPVTFLDTAPKPNDAASLPNSPYTANVEANRRWTIWRKSGVAGVGNTATLYYKTQRLTLFLPTAVDPTKTLTVNVVGGSTVRGFDLDSLRGRVYFPSTANVEGQLVTVSYTDLNGITHTGTTAVTDFVQWQDEAPANYLPTANDPPPVDSVSGLDTVIDTLVPIKPATNENNVAAFLDPFASATSPHKVWLFWNSTRNGTADIYSETIDPRFAPSPTIP